MKIKLGAGILTYVMAISILVSVALSMLILYLYYARLEYLSYGRQINLIENLQTAIEITKGGFKDMEIDKTYLYDLYGQESDSISISYKLWGLFDLFEVHSFRGSVDYAKCYILAHGISQEGKSAIYLQDEGRPLAVVGDTKISGVCYLPKAGVQSAYINRIGYKNEKLIYGEQRQSEKDFPELETDKVIKQLEKLNGNRVDALLDTTQSFLMEPAIIECFELEVSSEISGQVILKANNKIVFTNEAKVSDIIAYAPVIVFEEGFEGSGQFFVSDTLIANKNVKFNYPSALVAYNEHKPALIKLSEGSETNGWIMMDGKSDGLRRRVVYVEDGAKFQGLIYCNGLAEIYGEVIGNVTTRRFLVNAPSAVYENYLFNATIDATQLDLEFLTLSQWFYSDSTQVLKYLY